MTLRKHQVDALADFYVRAQQRCQYTQAMHITGAGEHDLRMAYAAMGTLWQMPCRSGKTMTALSVLYSWSAWLREWGIIPEVTRAWNFPHLVLVPTDIVRDTVWPGDWKKVAPPWTEQRLVTIPTLSHKEMWETLESLRPGDIAVMTYATLLCRAEIVTSFWWQVVIADEVHRLKNPKTDWTQVAYKLNSIFRLGMSATPYTNFVHELIDVLLWVQGWTWGKGRNSHIWPNRAHWKEAYCKWDYSWTDMGLLRRTPAGAAHPEWLYNKLRAEVMFSVTGEQVSNAPQPVIKPLPVPLSQGQREWYDKIAKGTIEWANRENVTMIPLARFGYLLQLCADPRQLGLEGESHKLRALRWIVEDVADKDEQVLVLTGYAKLANILIDDVRSWGYTAEAITGETKDRAGVVDRFASGETKVVVCTRAAWEGITLHAPYVVALGFVDHTPGLVKQAIMRAWNMMGSDPVTVYDVYAEGTIEEWNRKRLASKDRHAGVTTNYKDSAFIADALEGRLT